MPKKKVTRMEYYADYYYWDGTVLEIHFTEEGSSRYEHGNGDDPLEWFLKEYKGKGCKAMLWLPNSSKERDDSDG